MPVRGRHGFIWSKEDDKKLIDNISEGKNYTQLSVAMKIGVTSISKRIKELGFMGLNDAKHVMCD